jgi:hypothetical protein
MFNHRSFDMPPNSPLPLLRWYCAFKMIFAGD